MTSKDMLLDVKKRNEALKREGHFHIGEIAMKVIEKLVERDTPTKVIKDDDSSVISAYCPKCKRVVDIGYNGCPYCLQRLDWSDKDE